MTNFLLWLLSWVYELAFGCQHKKFSWRTWRFQSALSFPLTVRHRRNRPEAAKVTGTYCTCLNCGKELAYDWERMCVVSSWEMYRQERKQQVESRCF